MAFLNIRTLIVVLYTSIEARMTIDVFPGNIFHFHRLSDATIETVNISIPPDIWCTTIRLVSSHWCLNIGVSCSPTKQRIFTRKNLYLF